MGFGQAVEGDLDGEECGLGERGAVEAGGVGGRRFSGEQECAYFGVEVVADRVEGAGEGGLGRVQLASHAEALAALAGEEDGGAALGDGAACDVRRGAARGEGRERLGRVLAVGGEDYCSVDEGRSGGGEGVADVRRGLFGVGVDVLAEPAGLRAQGGRGTGGQRPCGGSAVRPGGRVPVLAVRCLGEHDMAVGAAHAEGADTGEELLVGAGPVAQRGVDAESEFVQGDVGMGLREVEARGQLAVP